MLWKKKRNNQLVEGQEITYYITHGVAEKDTYTEEINNNISLW